MKKTIGKTFILSALTGTAVLTLSGCAFFGGSDNNNAAADATTAVVEENIEEIAESEAQDAEETVTVAKIDGLEFDHEVPIEKAAHLSIDAYKDGYYVIKSHSGKDLHQLLVVPEGKTAPEGLAGDIVVIQQPVKSSKIDSISVAELLCEINSELPDKLTLVSVKQDKVYIDKIAENMEKGITKYAGKAADPDMDIIKEAAPQVYLCNPGLKKEEAYKKLQEAGINPFVTYYHSETDFLGRIEWIKALGVIYGDLDSAEKFFNDQKTKTEGIDKAKAQGKTFAMICLRKKDNKAFVRRTGDSIAKIGEAAGGINKMEDNPKGAWEEMSIDDFTTKYKDTDYLIYMDKHGDAVSSMSDLKGISELLSEFKAVQENNVWRTRTDYLQMNRVGDMAEELNGIFAGDSEAAAGAKEFVKFE